MSVTLTKKRYALAFALIFGMVCTPMVMLIPTSALDQLFYAWSAKVGPRPLKSQKVSLIEIDSSSAQTLNEDLPLSLKSHARLLRKIVKGRPKAVAYFMNFRKPNSNEYIGREDLWQDQASEFVAAAIEAIGNGVPVWLATSFDDSGEIPPPFPLSKIPHRVGSLIAHRAFLSFFDLPSLHVELAEMDPGYQNPVSLQVATRLSQSYVDFLIHPAWTTESSTSSTFDHFFAIHFLSEARDEVKDTPPSLFNRIVLVGTSTNLRLHAAAIETLLQNKVVSTMPDWLRFMTLAGPMCLLSYALLGLSPGLALFTTLFVSSLWFGSATVSLHFLNLWIPLGKPYLGIAVSLFLLIPFRWIREFQSRSKLQEERAAQLELEEMKNNFMNLVTHDLKTPIARIQGLTEHLQRQRIDPEITTAILKSTHDLNQFISTILDLSKAESKNFQFNPKSADMNLIIEECISKASLLAQRKCIAITSELCPLFPLPLDAGLITKVISNLIDNAIKYSPEHSTIRIATLERDEPDGSWVDVVIEDAGCGISELDLKQLFSKFYRGSGQHVQSTSGTGLGLYLCRFYIEMHKGSIDVASKLGEGSTFKFSLPKGKD